MVARNEACSRRRMLLFAAGLLLTTAIPRAGHALGPSGFVLQSDALASVGGRATAGPHTLGLTLGQTFTGPGPGPAASGPHEEFAGFWRPSISTPVGVELEPAGALPTSFQLQPVTPNPTRGRFRFRLGVPAGGSTAPIRAQIFDVSGRFVSGLPIESRSPGWHSLAWDGRDDSGAGAGLGVYFLRVETDGFSASRRFVVIR